MRTLLNREATLALLIGWASLAGAQQILVMPYIQPGPFAQTAPNEVVLLRWITDAVPGKFEVRYGLTPEKEQRTLYGRVELKLSPQQHYYRYTSALVGLPLDRRVYYELLTTNASIRTGSFLTRRSSTNAVSFIVTGDLADEDNAHRTTAFRAWTEDPDFMVLVGDIAYDRGRVSNYLNRFWDPWNNTAHPGPLEGAPVFGSIMTFAVMGNHDVAATNLTLRPDGLAAFYFFTAPTNGPPRVRAVPSIIGSVAQVNQFRAQAGPSFPGLFYYSFDNGPVHGVALDMNDYVETVDPAVRAWLERDLSASRAPWKFVFCHQPGFHTSKEHYPEQRLRLLQPLFEKLGVTLVFSGHVHNYERSKPLRFVPMRLDKSGAVDGRFEIDNNFDGRERTSPRGVIHIVTGAGGADLYTSRAALPLANVPGPNWVPFTATLESGRHSFTSVRATQDEVHLRQLDHQGNVIDEIRITKDLLKE